MTVSRAGVTTGSDHREEITEPPHQFSEKRFATLWQGLPKNRPGLTRSAVVSVHSVTENIVPAVYSTHRMSGGRHPPGSPYGRFRSRWHLRNLSKLYRLVVIIGRWSMIDVFMISILVAVVHFGFLANVTADPGMVCFALVVILTIFAAELFDPRSMWDAAGLNGVVAPPLADGTPPETESPTESVPQLPSSDPNDMEPERA